MYFKDLRIILENRIAPKVFIKSNEFYGIQYGEINSNKNIKKILISLDINIESIHYAIKHKVDLIISHHGLLKTPIQHINRILINKLNLLSKYPLIIYIIGFPFIAAEEGISETISKMLYLTIDRMFKIKNKKKNLIPIGRICIPKYYPNEQDKFTLEKLLIRIKGTLI